MIGSELNQNFDLTAQGLSWQKSQAEGNLSSALGGMHLEEK